MLTKDLKKDIKKVTARYPALINDYYNELASIAGTPIVRQVMPDIEELSPDNEMMAEDPVGEDLYSPVPNLTHRYQDRVLLLISDRCPIYCRFCTRKRKVGRSLRVTDETVREGIDYIKKHPGIRDVLLSGGDPLMLENERLDQILSEIRDIPHVEILRIGTRVPAAYPERVSADLAALLGGFSPLYIHTHFNHPAEITTQSREACRVLADAGIPLGNQTVLLGGINDDPDTLEKLFRELLLMRVRPYYLFQMDAVRGTRHFSTPLMTGVRIMEELHRRTSPMALPTFVVDLPDGQGKVFPTHTSILFPGTPEQAIITWDGKVVPYPD
ncbi:MAG: KamA family radical SAM protein [bacterium]|nr:KamA family radical SAM protein [bacterium]MDT8366119.1 KamA family radical SAM protein [bacterium]